MARNNMEKEEKLEQTFEQIVFIRVKTLSRTNLVASRHIKREKSSFSVEVCFYNKRIAHTDTTHSLQKQRQSH